MTASEIALVFRAKRSGRGRWRAVCPVHGGRHSGPLSIAEGHSGTIVKCFGGCDTEDVLAKVGLKLGDLFLDHRAMTPQIRRKLADEQKLDKLDRKIGLCIMAQAVMPEESRYWRAVEQNLFEREYDLRCKLFPREKSQREREYETQRIIREYGFDELWDCLPLARLQARILNKRKKHV